MVAYPDDEGFNLFGALSAILASYHNTGYRSLELDANTPYSLESCRADLFVPCPHRLDAEQTWKFFLTRAERTILGPDDSRTTIIEGLLLDIVVHWYWSWNLSVSSKYGSSTPAVGTEVHRSYRDISCSADPFVPDGSNPRVQYQCIGWKGTGSVPSTGTGTNVIVQVKQDSTLEWQWATNFLIECSIAGEATPRTVSKWQRKGDPLVLTVETEIATPNVVLTGDADGVVFDSETRTITIPSDRPRSLFARIDSSSKLFPDKTLQLTSGGDTEWSIVAEPSASDGFCLRSGSIAQGETSTVEMQVEVDGTFSFDWKISANRSDWAYFYVDGTLVASITRSTDWANVTTNLVNGTHTLRWVFDRHAATAANDEAAFLDNVSWRPRLSLTVSSAFGTASPAIGTGLVAYGDLVSASVVAPAADNGTRRVCTGWTGTGSVPEEGTASAVQFVMTKTSTLAWNWRTERWIDVSVVSGGTTSFQPQWIENGKTVSISVVPDTHLFHMSLAGDTEGATISGPTITFAADRPRTIRVMINEIKVPLLIESAHGIAVPSSGQHEHSWGDLVWCEATEPTDENGIRYTCVGWHGNGSAPSTGTDKQFQFRIEEPTSVVWQWQTNVCIELETHGAIAIDVAKEWREIGSSLIVPYAPLADYVSFSIDADADGVVIDGQKQTITIPADRPRCVSITATALSLASALDTKGLEWTTSGGDLWIPQREISFDGVDAAASGDATVGDNLLETSVLGPGTLAWFWKMDTTGWAGVDASVDNHDVAYLETVGDWTSASTQISGDGPHSIRFSFWTEEGCSASDRAYLDQVTWTGSTIPRATHTTPEAVPYAWLDRWPELLAENEKDYERAASATAANGINSVWECYVAGLDPTDPAAAFLVDISIENGEPRISWIPDLGPIRDYMLEGRTNLLEDTDWESPPTHDHRFFRARVGLPDESGGAPVDDAFPGYVTVSFDPNGGTVDLTSLGFEKPGTLGPLPTPIWGNIPFLGWYSSPTGGVRFTQSTEVPYRDTRLFAHWALDGWSWTVEEDGVAITGCSLSGNITVPWILDGALVKWIDYGAFSGNSGITSVTIPDSVEEIEDRAFYGCSALTSITIPDSVTTIGRKAFYGCSALTSITIPDSVTTIGREAFSLCSSLTSITIPDRVTNIAYGTFIGSGLTSIDIPNSVTNIEDYAFRYTALETLTIGTGVRSIGDYAFDQSILKTIEVPDSLTSLNWLYHRYNLMPYEAIVNISDMANWVTNGLSFLGANKIRLFLDGAEITSFAIPDTVTRIGGAFRNCSGLTTITIPNSVTWIGAEAFRNCSGLTSITIPDSVEGIWQEAFSCCSNLTSITISDGLAVIGPGAFSCSGLKTITIPSSVTKIYFDAFYDCSGLESVTISDGVTCIGGEAFCGCLSLTEVTIPDSVTSIEGNAFFNCSNLSTISLPKRFEGNISDMGIPSGCTVIFRE